MKSNSSKFLTPSDFSSNTVLARFVRWISGMLFGNSSFK
jgi:hypothetical protein